MDEWNEEKRQFECERRRKSDEVKEKDDRLDTLNINIFTEVNLTPSATFKMKQP